MATIHSIREQLNDALDAQALIYGDNTELNQEQLDDVSAAIDSVNETNNPNLPERPHA